jgi:hypothetical protein
MKVYCFTINNCRTLTAYQDGREIEDKNSVGPIPVEDLSKEFGENIPKYVYYDGGYGSTVLFCVDINVDVRKICEKYNYRISDRLEIIDVESSMYNNRYSIYPNYRKDAPPYHLEITY